MRTVSRGTYALAEDGRQAYLTLEPEDGPPQTHAIPAYMWSLLQRAADGDGKLPLSPGRLMRMLAGGGKGGGT